MAFRIPPTLIALVTTALMAVPAQAQPSDKSAPDPRPDNPTRNLPSDTGSQTTQPSGAVTGAGQPQGTLPQPDSGKGGVEERARKDSGAEGNGAAKAADDGRASDHTGAKRKGAPGNDGKRP
jgi:hypothetical protein